MAHVLCVLILITRIGDLLSTRLVLGSPDTVLVRLCKKARDDVRGQALSREGPGHSGLR
jgi:hypothetical protein